MRTLNNRGQSLVLAYMAITVFILLASSLSTRAIVESKGSIANNRQAEVFYMAEGGTENAISAFTSAIANYQAPPASVTTSFTTFGNANVTSTIIDLESGNTTDRMLNEGGTAIHIRQYEIVSTAIHPADPNTRAVVHQIIERRLIPTFQHAVFYNDDLEMLPGANMNLSGRIHTNGNMFIDADSGATLNITSTYMRSAGSIYNQRKDNNTTLAGEVSIQVTKSGSPKYENMNGLDSDNATWATEAINRWNGTVESAVHGVTKLSVPAVGNIQPGGYYNSHADLVVMASGATIVVTKGGVVVPSTAYPANTFRTTTTFYNNREEGTVQMVEIDMRKLAGYNSTNATNATFTSLLPSNGLMYVNIDQTGSYEPGVALTNASQLYRNGGLTVVSDDPVYVKGNYNTVNEQPASIICDSVNLVSGAWNDTRSAGGLSSRIANATTYNAAFIAGIDNTTAGSYNGGLENYPRLHENWSGTQLTIKGSFVELWNSQRANGTWAYGGDQYTAPQRNWRYNTNYNNVSNLPPFTPYAVEAQRIAWWQE